MTRRNYTVEPGTREVKVLICQRCDLVGQFDRAGGDWVRVAKAAGWIMHRPAYWYCSAACELRARRSIP